MIKITSADFVKSAAKPAEYPSLHVPEFAFFGRSNAGKSSLINMVVARKSLVKTGSRPGMTRLVNFFLVNKAFTLVDLPGYGYAQRSLRENEAFDRMLADYASLREELKAVFFLMDMRRIPGEVERESIAYFEGMGREVVIVGTKADKVSKNDCFNAKRAWAQFFGKDPASVIITSGHKSTGRDEILKAITSRLR
jgi:GTP-binding protein